MKLSDDPDSDDGNVEERSDRMTPSSISQAFDTCRHPVLWFVEKPRCTETLQGKEEPDDGRDEVPGYGKYPEEGYAESCHVPRLVLGELHHALHRYTYVRAMR